MKHVYLTLAKPPLPDSLPIKHTGTTWQVSKRPDFSIASNLLVDVGNDTVNLLEYDTDLDIADTATVYVRTRYHFTNSTDVDNILTFDSGWSRISSLRGNQKGITVSDVIIATPKVHTAITYLTDGTYNLAITTSAFKMFAGPGAHGSSSWLITDDDGSAIYKRPYDEDNLTSLVINSKELPSDKILLIRVSHQSDTNSSSYDGVAVLKNSAKKTQYYQVEQIGDLVDKRRLWFRLNSFTHLFKSFDIIVKDKYGAIVDSFLNQKTMTPSLLLSSTASPLGVIPYETYNIFGRILLTTGTYSEYELISSNILDISTSVKPNPFLTYVGKFDYTQEMILGSQTVQVSPELYTGSVLLARHYDNAVYRYRIRDGKLVSTGKSFQLPVIEKTGIPYVNIIPLRDGNVLINYCADTDGYEYESSIFAKYQHNAGSNSFSFIASKKNDKQLLSTSVSNSVGVSTSNTIFYIPAGEVDAFNNEINLSLYSLHPTTLTSTKIANLPFDAVKYVSLVMTNDDKLIIFGGVNAGGCTATLSGNHYTRTNDDVYSFDTKTGIFTKLFTFIDIPNTIYNLQGVLRKDSKILAFNSVNNGPSLGNQNTITMDVDLLSYTYDINDMSDVLPYQSILQMQNGDILRISSIENDPQVVYRYIANSMLEADIDENTDIVETSQSLTVEYNETITIEDPYRYTSITIKGNDLTDTGTLRWVVGKNVLTFNYRDLIITRDTVMNETTYNQLKPSSLTVLDGVKFILSSIENPNVLIVPAYETITITDPGIYTKIIIMGESDIDTGTLIWENIYGKLTTYHYNDLIVTRTTIMLATDYEEANYASVTLLDNCVLKLKY